MATILSVAEVRDHVETDLIDDALTRLIEDADEEIIARGGAAASYPYDTPGGGARIVLPRKASAIVSISERILNTDYALAAADYSLFSDGRTLERRVDGTYPSSFWRGHVSIVITPVLETALRKRILIDLVKLAVAYSAISSKSVDGVSLTALPDYQVERNRILGGLSRGRLGLA